MMLSGHNTIQHIQSTQELLSDFYINMKYLKSPMHHLRDIWITHYAIKFLELSQEESYDFGCFLKNIYIILIEVGNKISQ